MTVEIKKGVTKIVSSGGRSYISPCSGIVETVLTEENDHVYEWEKLFLIKTQER